ncbi:MAG: BTAD domain-containing putative transcriptional regulator [Chloroflexota bacterium]|nr:BTAD domain-containing putative transcriptional regulator [Chloroflexota bacterium]
MATLQIHVLGSFRVLRNKEPISAWRSRQTRTILKVLLVRRGHVVPAEQLLDVLWPEDDPQDSRSRLHVRLSQLRRVLDPDDPSAYVLTVEDGYIFNPEADYWLDVAEFETLAQQGQQDQEKGALVEAITAYETASSLYQGDLLEEDLYEDWSFAERERLRELLLTVLTELAECYAQQGRYRQAIARCHQVLALDSYREAVYIRLMLYQYYAGERTQAIRTYECCRRVLIDELGVEPLPATVALAEQIRSGVPGRAEGTPHYPSPIYEGRLFQVPYSLGHTPFVGREREYAWMIERWRSAETGVILIQGEAGVGKSRLIDEFLGYAAAQETTIIRSRATAGKLLPYVPSTEALRAFLKPDDRDISPTTLASLAPLFPELQTWYPNLPKLSKLSEQEEQARLFRAVKTLLQARVPRGTILFVDDAHYADGASVDLLAHLTACLTIVLACRSEEMFPDHPLHVALQPLRLQDRLAELTLESLSPTATQTLVCQLAGENLPDLVERLVAQTGGNPLFMVASLQYMFEEGALYVGTEGIWEMTDDAVLSLPPTVRQTIEARLRRLSGNLRRVFDLVAVIGDEFDFALLQHAGQMEENSLLIALDELLEVGLLVEPRTTGRSEFALAHSRYGEVAYNVLPQARRRRLHRQVANALEATAPDMALAAPALAHHFEQAQDASRAFDWLVRAGDAADERYARDEALAFYQRAVALETGETAPVWERMGCIAHHLARYADGIRFYEMALARWRALGEANQEIVTHYALAECHRELSQYNRATENARAGLEIAATFPDCAALIAKGHVVLSNALRSGQLAPTETVREHLERALEMAKSAEEWQLVGEATFWLAVVAVNSGDANTALDYDREALAQFRRTSQAGWEAIALNNIAYHALLAGQPDLALEMAKEGLALARRIGSLNTQGWLLSTLGEIQTHMGQLDAAYDTLEEGLALVTQWGPPRLRPGFLADLGQVNVARWEWDAALASLEEALDLALEIAPQFVPRLGVYLAQVYLGKGDLVQAESQAQQAQEAARQKGQESVEGQAWRILGATHAAAGREAKAETAFTRSLDQLEAVGDSLEAARTRYLWGDWLKRQGDERAEEWLNTARQTFERCGAAIDLRNMEP